MAEPITVTVTNLSGPIKTVKVANKASGSAVTSVAGKTGVVLLEKSDVGLSNVDNTPDANKPVSDDTQTALDTKQALLLASGGYLNGHQILTDASSVVWTITKASAILTLTGDAHTLESPTGLIEGQTFTVEVVCGGYITFAMGTGWTNLEGVDVKSDGFDKILISAKKLPSGDIGFTAIKTPMP